MSAKHTTEAAKQAKNTDVEIWRREPENYYSPSIHVTVNGDIGIDVGGLIFVMSVEKWHKSQASIEELEKELLTLITFSADLQHRLEAEKAELVEALEMCLNSQARNGHIDSDTYEKARALLAKAEPGLEVTDDKG